jgi:crotonobetainyl-CoA:carnitine CoA-transferase CaiB-like acyl-CoA transferase
MNPLAHAGRLAARSVTAAAGWLDAPIDDLRFTNPAHVLPTRLPVGPAAAGVIGAVGLAAAELWRGRTGRPQAVTVDATAAALATAGNEYLRVNGEPRSDWGPITGFYRARGDAWVYLHGNFPHLRDGLLAMLGCAGDRTAVEAAVSNRDADDIEVVAGARGLCAVRVRPRAAWDALPQARATAALPLVEIRRIGDAPPLPLPDGDAPLAGARVLDLSRVIAGPMVGRTLAEHGATVMLVSSPKLPSIESLVIDTGFGKYAAAIELDTAAGHATLESLARGADIFIDGYRPASLAARGFSPQALAALRPGIVCVKLSAFGATGPWSGRRGYDSLVQAAVGLARVDTPEPADPRRLPCQPLDYLGGYLGAFGAMVALARRSREGGSWSVRVSLERTARWLWEMHDAIGPVDAVPAQSPAFDTLAAHLERHDSRFGTLACLRAVPSLGETPPRRRRPPVPLGSDPPAWPASP